MTGEALIWAWESTKSLIKFNRVDKSVGAPRGRAFFWADVCFWADLCFWAHAGAVAIARRDSKRRRERVRRKEQGGAGHRTAGIARAWNRLYGPDHDTV